MQYVETGVQSLTLPLLILLRLLTTCDVIIHEHELYVGSASACAYLIRLSCARRHLARCHDRIWRYKSFYYCVSQERCIQRFTQNGNENPIRSPCVDLVIHVNSRVNVTLKTKMTRVHRLQFEEVIAWRTSISFLLRCYDLTDTYAEVSDI